MRHTTVVGFACCLLARTSLANPQVLAYERMEARQEYEAMLGRMDANEDRVLTRAEIDAVEDDMLLDEVPKQWALKADTDSDGKLTWDEYLAFKSPPLPEKEEL